MEVASKTNTVENNQTRTLKTKNKVLFDSLCQYYNSGQGEKINQLIDIIIGKSKVSLRMLDWFVTNYAKKNNVFYELKKGDKKQYFNVYIDYKNQLTAYKKKCFDPFCRKERIHFYYQDKDNKDKTLITTLGQLNFFKWAIKNRILDYVNDHYQDIEYDMLSGTVKRKIEIKDGNNKGRKELSVSATKKIKKHYVKVILTFD